MWGLYKFRELSYALTSPYLQLQCTLKERDVVRFCFLCLHYVSHPLLRHSKACTYGNVELFCMAVP
uniref:Uncharacterized protein n=1 Tax=Arundo donax TaxID=35708 RepID=A0A0A9EBC7_ARUDO